MYVNGNKMMKEKKYQIPMRCQNCGHEWYYGGDSDKYTSCPNCRYRVNIQKQRLDSEEKEDRTPEEKYDLKKGESKEFENELEVKRARFTGKYWISLKNTHKDISENEWEELRDRSSQEEFSFEDFLKKLLQESERPIEEIIKKLKAQSYEKLDSWVHQGVKE